MRKANPPQAHPPDDPFSVWAENYLRYVKLGAGYSKTTCKAYQSQLRRFERWALQRLGRAPLLADVHGRLVREYVLDLSESGCRPRTVRSAVMPLRSLFNYLVETEVLEVSPVHSVRLPKKDAAHRPRVTEEELQALVDACDRLATPERAAMGKALVLVLITSALRRNELLFLKLRDLDLETGQLVVTSGKGAKSRSVFLPEEALEALARWIERRPPCKHDYLFIVDTNRRLGNNGLAALLNEIKAAAGLRDHDNIQPHAVRHAAATRLLRRGADLKSIQTVLGHANLATTAMYLHTDEEQLRAVARLASLKASEPVTAEKSINDDAPPAQLPAPRQDFRQGVPGAATRNDRDMAGL